MKVTYHRKKHDDALYDVSFRCSPLEALTILSALRTQRETETDERDIRLIDKMLADAERREP